MYIALSMENKTEYLIFVQPLNVTCETPDYAEVN